MKKVEFSVQRAECFIKPFVYLTRNTEIEIMLQLC